MAEEQHSKRVRLTRDGILFFAGLAGVIYETGTGGERVTLLLLFAAMMGLPAFLQNDERSSKKSEDHES